MFSFARCAIGMVLLAALDAPSPAVAPEPTARQALEPLRRALATAWQTHPAALEAQAKLQAAQARARAAGQPLYNPELEVAADNEGVDHLRTIGLSQALDLSGKRTARRALGDAELAQAQAEFAVERAEFAHDWLDAWSRVLSMARQVEYGEKRLALSNRMAELAQRRLTAGDISSPECDLVLLARDEALAEQATLSVDAALAQEAFVKVGGPQNATSIALPNEPPALQTATVVEVTALPEWQVVAAKAEGAQRRVTVAERDRRPDPTVRLQGGRIDSGPLRDSVIGIAVSVPLFVRNGFHAETEAARADADGAQAALQRQRLELQARADRATAMFTVTRDAWVRWQHSRATDLSARSSALERLWVAGELSTSDYVLQLKQTLDTALAGAALEGRVWQSYFDYLHAVGQLGDWIDIGHPP